METKEILKLAVKCGIVDETLSDLESGYVVSDYGDITESVIKFAKAIEKHCKNTAPSARGRIQD